MPMNAPPAGTDGRGKVNRGNALLLVLAAVLLLLLDSDVDAFFVWGWSTAARGRTTMWSLYANRSGIKGARRGTSVSPWTGGPRTTMVRVGDSAIEYQKGVSL